MAVDVKNQSSARSLKVKIQADAFMVCLTHALSTDREEVMGLLIGEVC